MQNIINMVCFVVSYLVLGDNLILRHYQNKRLLRARNLTLNRYTILIFIFSFIAIRFFFHQSCIADYYRSKYFWGRFKGHNSSVNHLIRISLVEISGGSRNFHKWGPTGCLKGGPISSRFSDSLYKQPLFSQKGPPKSSSGNWLS